MTNKQVWIAVGVAGAVLALGYLATKREVNANISSEPFTLTYKAGLGAAAAPAAQEDSHQKVMEAVEESSAAIEAYTVPTNPWGIE